MSSSTSSSEPLRLLVRTALAGAIMALVLGWGYCFGPPVARIDYHGAVAAKQARLRQLPSPKVVIVGGSNAAFGIDSERLEQALCRPVVNMAIHASLGVEYMVNEVKSQLGQGDLVITSFELSAYNKAIKDNEVHVLTVDRAPGALEVMPWYRRPRIHVALAIMRCQAAWKYATGEWNGEVPDQVYRADGFNERGDMVAHLGLPPRGPARQQPVEHRRPFVGTDIFPLLQELQDSASAHGAQVVFTWPSIAASSERKGINAAISAGMAEAGLAFLGDAADNVLPDTMFHDTHYHLRASGRDLRTARLIHDLCATSKIACCVQP